ncbi:GNAT family N-acetyltransferase [Polynucleobacter sp. AM-25C3]|jgi:RimJ/RimL family protein N-acetyltransferase|uniref:GNAT family N-acetyltransferase n=1 Tax=Polynucleobacter sp. AM-25C3 TaxID=1855569 RepID=UPI001C0E821F|nr:GNAT family N-acetyltransferase [Polynucleobacter sp. AM-25C3]MBU3601826.1 GNAT family N-acetyltransferase [Polynucleobacter sp. AM-25C3]
MDTISINNALQSSFIKKWSLVHGGEYEIRPITPDDREAVLDLFQHLSSQSRYFRYAHAMSTLPEDLLEQIIHASNPNDFALAAFIRQEGESTESLVGISRYVRDANSTRGEFSLSVSDDYHHEGIGSHLMQGILDCARLNGLSEIYGFVIKENHDMLVLMRHLGYELHTDEDDAKMYIATNSTA